MRKKLTACVLTAAVTLGLFAVPAFAEDGAAEPLLTEETVQTGGAEPAAAESGEEAGSVSDSMESPAANWEENMQGLRAQILRETEEYYEPEETLFTQMAEEEDETLFTGYAVSIPEGHYYLVSGVGSNMVLDVYGGSKAKKANVQIYKKNNTKAQQFYIEKIDGYYRILNDNSGYALDVKGGSAANKANVWQYPWNGTNAQLWSFEDAGDGYYYIVNLGSKKALDVKGAKSRNKTNVWQYTLNNSKAQKWKLVDLSGNPVSGTSEPVSTAGANDYIGQGGTFHIFSMADTDYALEVEGASKSSKANVHLFQYDGSAEQTWVFSYQGNGCYKITNKNSGLALDVYGGKAGNKKNVWQYKWNGTNAQLWKIKENGDDTCTIVSALDENYVLDVYGGKAANKRNVQIYKANGTSAQKWTLYPEGTSPGSGSADEPDSADPGSYTDTNSILVLVNKKHPLSSSYVPSDLVAVNTLTYDGRTVYMRAEAAAALKTMFDAAKNEGIYLKAGSGYRSYSTQASLYSSYVSSYGQSSADRFSARPGYSEHQTGLAMDISDYSEANYVEESFENTSEGIWLAANAYKYGFILRYPSTKESVTGYMYEPWHFRYVGVETAAAVYSHGADYTYEEYTGLEGGASY